MAKKARPRKKVPQKQGKRSVTTHVPRPRQGTLFIVGGREDIEGDRAILNAFVERIGSGKLVIATLATEYADEAWEHYQEIFRNFGIKEIAHLTITQRDEESAQ